MNGINDDEDDIFFGVSLPPTGKKDALKKTAADPFGSSEEKGAARKDGSNVDRFSGSAGNRQEDGQEEQGAAKKDGSNVDRNRQGTAVSGRQQGAARKDGSNVDRFSGSSGRLADVDEDEAFGGRRAGSNVDRNADSGNMDAGIFDFPFSLDEHFSSGTAKDRVIAGVAEEDIGRRWVESAPDRGSVLNPLTDKQVSEKTVFRYLQQSERLMRRFRRKNAIPLDEEINPVEFVNWILSLKPTLKASTWRLYRGAIRYFLETYHHVDVDKAMWLICRDRVEDGGEHSGERRASKSWLPRRTSALKEKSIPKAAFDQIVSYARNISRSELRNDLADWLIAGVLTGLRPIEWRSCHVKETRVRENGRSVIKTHLIVLNAKASNGRGNGTVRTLDISDMSQEHKAIICGMADRGAAWGKEEVKFSRKHSDCAQILYKIVETIWPNKTKYYSLYSCRHQFIANAKSMMPLHEVSALVGHGITRTAAQQYGKARSAWGVKDIPKMPKAIPEEAEMVRKTVGYYDKMITDLKSSGIDPAKKGFFDDEGFPI